MTNDRTVKNEGKIQVGDTLFPAIIALRSSQIKPQLRRFLVDRAKEEDRRLSNMIRVLLSTHPDYIAYLQQQESHVDPSL